MFLGSEDVLRGGRCCEAREAPVARRLSLLSGLLCDVFVSDGTVWLCCPQRVADGWRRHPASRSGVRCGGEVARCTMVSPRISGSSSSLGAVPVCVCQVFACSVGRRLMQCSSGGRGGCLWARECSLRLRMQRQRRSHVLLHRFLQLLTRARALPAIAGHASVAKVVSAGRCVQRCRRVQGHLPLRRRHQRLSCCPCCLLTPL